MKIGELANKTKVSTRSIRHYEAMGLIKSKRLSNGYREFDSSNVELIQQIGILLELGLPIKDILQLAPCLPTDIECTKFCPKIKSSLSKHRIALQKRASGIKKILKKLDAILD